jgi:two-component system response regulator DesR
VKAATSLRAEPPSRRVPIVTGYGRPGRLKRAFAAGVRGFGPKTVGAQQLAGIIRPCMPETSCADPELAADAISAGDSPPASGEAAVVGPAAGGAPVAKIVRRAAPSCGTVRNRSSSAVMEPDA